MKFLKEENEVQPTILPISSVIDRIPEFDYHSKRHLWAVISAWQVDPKQGLSSILDHENQLAYDGPACWYCEKLYNPDEPEDSPCPGPLDYGL